MDTKMTNEKKLDAIYDMLQRQESRQRRSVWMRFLKWLLIISFAYFVYSDPQAFSSRFTHMIEPMITATASGMIAHQKEELEHTIQKMISEK